MISDDVGANVAVPDLATAELQKLQPLLQRAKQATDANALIVGVGHRNKFGALVADACHCDGVPREFIENYSQIALRDVAAQLFVSNATSVLNISTLDDYPFNNNTPAAAVGTYLRKRSIAQLLLSGIDSSRGIAWITLYKTDDRIKELLDITASDKDEEMQVRKEWSSKNKDAKPGFTTMQCEFASYIIWAGLYDWQLACKRQVERALDSDRYKMIDLSPIELDVAVRAARGYVVKEISGELKISEYTVNKHLAAMRTAGFTRSGMAQRLIGKLPDHREPATKRTGRSPKKR